jgi:hypothetical protein
MRMAVGIFAPGSDSCYDGPGGEEEGEYADVSGVLPVGGVAPIGAPAGIAEEVGGCEGDQPPGPERVGQGELVTYSGGARRMDEELGCRQELDGGEAEGEEEGEEGEK